MNATLQSMFGNFVCLLITVIADFRTTQSSHNGMKDKNSIVIGKHSLQLFIIGFLTGIQNASNTFRANTSSSKA